MKTQNKNLLNELFRNESDMASTFYAFLHKYKIINWKYYWTLCSMTTENLHIAYTNGQYIIYFQRYNGVSISNIFLLYMNRTFYITFNARKIWLFTEGRHKYISNYNDTRVMKEISHNIFLQLRSIQTGQQVDLQMSVIKQCSVE